MVGADHQAIVGVGDGELDDHANACLDVANHEVATGVAQLLQMADLLGQALDAVGNVDGADLIGTDEVQRRLGVVLVMLGVVRQAHGNEAIVGVSGLGTQFFDRKLSQASGRGRVHAAADAQYQHLEAGLLEGVLDEGLAPFDFGAQRCVVGERRHHVEGGGDFGLAVAHVWLLTG